MRRKVAIRSSGPCRAAAMAEPVGKSETNTTGFRPQNLIGVHRRKHESIQDIVSLNEPGEPDFDLQATLPNENNETHSQRETVQPTTSAFRRTTTRRRGTTPGPSAAG